MRTRIPALLAASALVLSACTVVDGPEDLVSESSTTSTAPSTTTTAAETTSTSPSTTSTVAETTTTTQAERDSMSDAEVEAACQAAGEAYAAVETDVEVTAETRPVEDVLAGDTEGPIPEIASDVSCTLLTENEDGDIFNITLLTTTWAATETREWFDERMGHDASASLLGPNTKIEWRTQQTESNMLVSILTSVSPGYLHDPPEDFDLANPPEDWDGPNLEAYSVMVAGTDDMTVFASPSGFTYSISREVMTLEELQAFLDRARDAAVAAIDAFLSS